MMKDLRAGKIDQAVYRDLIAGYSQLEKRQKNMIMIQSLAVKANNNKPIKNLEKQGVIGGRTTIDLAIEEKEDQTVRCPINGDIITRAECLDYSGTHMDDCKGCGNFKETRDLLLGKQE